MICDELGVLMLPPNYFYDELLFLSGGEPLDVFCGCVVRCRNTG